MLNFLEFSFMRLSFVLLFALMLLYWGQAAFFSRTQYKKLTHFIFFSSFTALSLIFLLRWVESGHFPLSNLFESLLFLSWSFLLGLLLSEFHLSSTQINAFLYSSHLQKRKASRHDENKLLTSNIAFQEQTSKKDDGVPLLGVMITPLAFLSYAFAFLYLPKEMQKATALVPALQSNWLMMHVTVMICSYAALICGSVFSMAFLLINATAYGGGRDKLFAPEDHETSISKKKTSLGRLFLPSVEKKEATPCSPVGATPNLAYDSQQHEWKQAHISNPDLLDLCTKLDNLSYRMCGLGFPLLTIGIISGAVWANSAWGSYWSWDPKETWALITWLVFAVYLHARIAKGWQGERAATIATVGFFIVWFCYLGVNLWAQGLHSYGWLT